MYFGVEQRRSESLTRQPQAPTEKLPEVLETSADTTLDLGSLPPASTETTLDQSHLL